MKFQIPTLAIVLALKIDQCYTPVAAARKSIPEDIESARRRLTSLAKNNSFAGYGKRQNENERLYRVRMGKEFGRLAPFIKIEMQVGRNRKKYQAFSGCIYKLAVGEMPLQAANLALCNLLLLQHRAYHQPALPCLGTQPLFPEAVKLLETHQVQYELSQQPSKAEWLRFIPVSALDAVVLWACGARLDYPDEKPPAQVTAAFLSRLRPKNLPRPAGKLVRLDLPLPVPANGTAHLALQTEGQKKKHQLTHRSKRLATLVGWAVILVLAARVATNQTDRTGKTPHDSSIINVKQELIQPLDEPIQIIHCQEEGPSAPPNALPFIPIPIPSIAIK